jgi:bifunctional non-homologous end joining protein LigD
LGRLVDRRLVGIDLVDHTDASGELMFEQACRMGLEGIVSKRLSKPYKSGRSGHWLKLKNPESLAMIRARDAEW